MTPSDARAARWLRAVQVLPLLAALNLHGLTHQRYPLVVLAALALIVGLRRGWKIPFGEAAIAIAAVAGAALGFLYALVVPPPEGPVPPGLLSPMCGALVPLIVVAALSGTRTYSWVFAWLLAALSLSVRLVTPAGVASLAALLLSTLVVAALAQGASLRRGGAALAGLAALLAVSGAATWGVGAALFASQGFLVETVGRALEQLGDRLQDVAEFKLPDSVYVGAMGRVGDSKRALFEVSGALPGTLRGTVMDRFDGMAWTTSPELEKARPDLAALPPPPSSAVTTLRFLKNPGNRLPAPAGVRKVSGAKAEVRGGWVLAASGPLRGQSVELAGDAERALPPEPAPGEALLELPVILRKDLMPLAAEIVGAADTPRKKAEAIENFFQTKFRYSLKADLMGKGHPLVVLIKERRPAYCAYFASAMAALLRAQGIPSRLVGGFALEEVNPLTGASMVRERDAHAWVEAWLADEGRFVAFDPTPGMSRVEALGLERGLLGTLTEALSAWWDDQVMQFRKSPADYIQRLATSRGLWAVIFLVVAWRVSLRFRGKRTKALRGALAGANPRLLELYGRYVRILGRLAQVEPGPAETDDEVVERVRGARGEEAGAAARRFVAAYREARYRGVAWEPAALQSVLAEVEAALAPRR